MPHRKKKQRRCETKAAIAASRPPPKPKKNPLGARYLDSCSHPDALPSSSCQPIFQPMPQPSSAPVPVKIPVTTPVVTDVKPPRRVSASAVPEPKPSPTPNGRRLPPPTQPRPLPKKKERETKKEHWPPSSYSSRSNFTWHPCCTNPEIDDDTMAFMLSRLAEFKPIFMPGKGKVVGDAEGGLQLIQSGFVVVPQPQPHEDENTGTGAKKGKGKATKTTTADKDCDCHFCLQKMKAKPKYTKIIVMDLLRNVKSGKGTFGFKISEHLNQKFRRTKKRRKVEKPMPKRETYSNRIRKILSLSSEKAADAAIAEIDRKTEEIKATILGYRKDIQDDGETPNFQDTLTKLCAIEALECMASCECSAGHNIDFVKLINDPRGIETLREMRSKVTKDIADYTNKQIAKKMAEKAGADEKETSPAGPADCIPQEAEPRPVDEMILENQNSESQETQVTQLEAEEPMQEISESKTSDEYEFEKTVVLTIPEKYYDDVVRYYEKLKQESQTQDAEKSKNGNHSGQFDDKESFTDMNDNQNCTEACVTMNDLTVHDNKTGEQITGENKDERDEDLGVVVGQATADFHQDGTDHGKVKDKIISQAPGAGRAELLKKDAELRKMLAEEERKEKRILESQNLDRQSEFRDQEVKNGRSKSPKWNKYDRLFDDETLIGNTKDFGNLYNRNGDLSLGKENIAVCSSAVSQVGPSTDGEQEFLFSTPIHPRRFPEVFGSEAGEDVTGIRSPDWEEKKKQEQNSLYRRFANLFTRRK